ncbi:amidohydrolase family protein [Luteimonas panaciterrae]|uniref:amidohydrolase family protein n=1 Tax=Luteimonas panaciterrae TaxID=363885 RepID=UPI001CF99385|nr:amidohydrolase family protein [Luteimonas panaciterrae]
MMKSRQRRLAGRFAAALLLALGCVSLANAQGSRILVRNAELVLTMDPQLGQGELGSLEKADVLLEDGRIVQVGKKLPASGATVIDASGKIVMPGFVDTHTHLWQSMIRDCGTDQTVVGWLSACMRDVGPRMTPEQTYAAVRLSIFDAITTGVTTVTDWSHAFNAGFANADLRALTDSGLRFVFAYCFDPAQEGNIRRVKQEVIDHNPLAHLQLCGIARSGNEAVLAGMVRLADELGVDTNVHLHENIADRQNGQIASLEQAGAIKSNLMVNHAIHLTDEEITLLASRGVRVAHCPLSNMRLASGVIRMPELLQAGIKIGLGLDGGTNDTTDMFNLMRAAVGLQRASRLSATTPPTVAQVLRMATLGGAEVLGLEHEIGSLTPGKRADLIVIDPEAANFAPKVDWPSQIVFNGQPRNVETVIVGGRLLKARGKVLGISEAVWVEQAERLRKPLD